MAEITIRPQQNTDTVLSLKKLQGKKKFSKKQISLFLACIFIITGGVSGTYVFLQSRHTNTNITAANHDTNANPDTSITPVPTPITYQNPFNGTAISENDFISLKNRPMAVMIDNSPQGRVNQHNLNKADIIYEALVEGGYTRFMPIYYSDQSDFRVMPVRSTRQVFLDNLTEYNDILIYHVGGANTPNEPRTDAVNRIIRDKIKSIYYYAGNLWKLYNELYDPGCASNPGIPGYSCKYRMTHDLYQKADEAGYQSEQWEKDRVYAWAWNFDQNHYTQSDKEATKINYNFAANRGFDAEWNYDESTRSYLRVIDKKPLIDKATNEQVRTNTIIVQKIKYRLNVDDQQRVIAFTEGNGEAYIFMNGKAYEVEWKKLCNASDPKQCRTRYYEKSSEKEFVFAPGKIWVSVTRDLEPVTYE